MPIGTPPKVYGITRSLNEVDIIESSLRRMLEQVDHIIIGDNSTDGTWEKILALQAEGLPITLHWDDAPSVAQRDVMTAYANEARNLCGEWGVFFDIDELWYADNGPIRDVLMDLPEHILIAPARNLNHCVTSLDDLSDPDPFSRMAWRSVEMLPLGKVACRLRDDLEIGHGNHSAAYRRVRRPAAVNGVLESRHFPYRSPEQFIARVKTAWPQLRDSGLPESHGAHMWAYGRHLDEFGEEGLHRWFMDGMYFDEPENNPDLVRDPVGRLALA